MKSVVSITPNLSATANAGSANGAAFSPTGVAQRPRILLDLLGYGPNDGGFATSVHSLLESAAQLDEFDFGLLHHRSYREFFSRWQFRRHEVSFPRRLKFFASLWITPWVARRHRYDVVHADISLISPWLARPGSMRVHDLYFMIDPAACPRKLAQRLATRLFEPMYVHSIRRAQIVGVVSECTRRDVGRLVGRERDVVLMPHAVPPPALGTSSHGWPTAKETARLLFVGSVVTRKNLRVLLEALVRVQRPWALDVVGNLWWGAPDIAAFAGDRRVRLHGFVDDVVLQEFYRNAHAVVIPSLYEGFGLPAAQAINAGCLSLTSNGSAFDEYIPASCRFDPRSSGELAAILDRLDDEIVKRLWQQSLCSVARYSLQAQTDAYRAAFQALVTRSPAHRGKFSSDR